MKARALCLVLACGLASSCVSSPEPRAGSALGTQVSAAQNDRARIEASILMGSPSSFDSAVSVVLSSSSISKAEAKTYEWLAREMARLAYPELAAPSVSLDAPPEDALARAFIEARNGRPLAVQPGQGPLYELMPLMAVFRVRTQTAAVAALAAYERFASLGVDSALARYARGIALERAGDSRMALESYRAALDLAAECYPAALAASRLFVDSGKPRDALATLAGIQAAVLETNAYRRAYAYALYGAGNWDEALPLITLVLLDDPLDSRFMLMRAHLLMERAEYKLAAPLLNAYASVDPNDKLYLLLRARYAAEKSKYRARAVAALRKGLERYPNEQTLLLYAAEILFAGDAKERLEAITYAGKALKNDPSSIRALKVLLAADLAAANGPGASARADTILSFYPAYEDYESLYRAYVLAGRQDDALAMARLWREKQPGSETASLAWARLLVDRGNRAEASSFITAQLAAKGSAGYRSNLYFLQSRIQTNEEAALASLRSALIENGLNVDALVAMTDIYIKRADYQRARFYLKQALSLAPDRADLAQRRDTLVQFGVAIP